MFKARLRAPAIAIVAIVFASVLASPAQAAATKYPLTIKFGGYTTKIAKKPTKIISLSPSATEILYAIGAGNQVIAVDDLSNYPSTAPITKLSAFSPNVEALMNYKPDLIILNADATKALEVKAALEKLKIKVFLERAPLNLKQAYLEITALGRATGKISGAQSVISDMKSKITAL